MVYAHTSIEKIEIQLALKKLYLGDAIFEKQELLMQLKQPFKNNTVLYTANFNDKIIGAVWVTPELDAYIVHDLAIHPANRGRGIATRLVSEVERLIHQHHAVQLHTNCAVVMHILSQIKK